MLAGNAFGDASMRTFMNWQDLTQPATLEILAHWQKLGQFRQAHDSVGSGKHQILNQIPYIFKRELGTQDKVLVAKGLSKGIKKIPVYQVFNNGDLLFDYYSNQEVVVMDGQVSLSSEFTYLLLGKVK